MEFKKEVSKKWKEADKEWYKANKELEKIKQKWWEENIKLRN